MVDKLIQYKEFTSLAAIREVAGLISVFPNRRCLGLLSGFRLRDWPHRAPPLPFCFRLYLESEDQGVFEPAAGNSRLLDSRHQVGLARGMDVDKSFSLALISRILVCSL